MKNPERAARRLHKLGLTAIEYKELQWERWKRLDFFKSKGIKPLIDDTQRLYDFGEEVYKLLQQYEKSKIVNPVSSIYASNSQPKKKVSK